MQSLEMLPEVSPMIEVINALITNEMVIRFAAQKAAQWTRCRVEYF